MTKAYAILLAACIICLAWQCAKGQLPPLHILYFPGQATNVSLWANHEEWPTNLVPICSEVILETSTNAYCCWVDQTNFDRESITIPQFAFQDSLAGKVVTDVYTEVCVDTNGVGYPCSWTNAAVREFFRVEVIP